MDLSPNPYAPPAAEPMPRVKRGARATSSYANEQRSVALCVLLTVLTLGVYSGVWFLRRRRFFDALHSDKKLGPMPAMVLGLVAVSWVVALAGAPPEVDNAVSVGVAVVNLVMAFRAAAILRDDLTRSGRFLRVSGVGTFFFGALYLQYKINEAAGVPARAGTRKRKKKAPREVELSAAT